MWNKILELHTIPLIKYAGSRDWPKVHGWTYQTGLPQRSVFELLYRAVSSHFAGQPTPHLHFFLQVRERLHDHPLGPSVVAYVCRGWLVPKKMVVPSSTILRASVAAPIMPASFFNSEVRITSCGCSMFQNPVLKYRCIG